MQSTIQQSPRHSFPSGASHGRGSVSSDHAHGDAASPGESGLQLPGAQQRSGDLGSRACTVMGSNNSPHKTCTCVSSISACLIPQGLLFVCGLMFNFKIFTRMWLNTKSPRTDFPEMSCAALLCRINHLSFHCLLPFHHPTPERRPRQSQSTFYFCITNIEDVEFSLQIHFLSSNMSNNPKVHLVNTKAFVFPS